MRVPAGFFQGRPILSECDRCTACCRGPGQVKVTDTEIGRVAAHLGGSEGDSVPARVGTR